MYRARSTHRSVPARLLRGVAALGCALAALPAAAADEPPVTDPTRPPYDLTRKASPAPGAGDALLLSSTQVSPESRSAVVNGRAVTVGSRVGDAVVVSIEEGRVTLRRGAQSIVLQLLIPTIRLPARDAS